MRAPIVGRDLELRQLDDALADARSGRGGVVLLVGEPGIGKSRLCEEIARRSNLEVVWGRAWEAGGAPAYWPWTQVLRAIGGAPTTGPVARIRGDVIEGPSVSVEDRFLIFDAIARHLAAVGRPLLIVFEDLHAADEPSLHLLAFVATQLAAAPILIVGTYRDVEARLTASAGAVLDRIARASRVIHPRRLGPDDVAALVAADDRSALPPDAVAAVFRRSEGNPLFVIELLRVISRRGAGGAVPASVRTAIREHLRAVPAQITSVLEAAAVIGREFSASVLGDVCGRPPGEIADVLESALELGLVIERGPSRYAFFHGLIAETLHADLPSARRSELHGAVATALERDPSPPLAEIAHHLLHAGADHAARACHVALQAAERARRQLAFEPAIELVERVFATAPPADDRTRFELLRLLAEVRIVAGDDTRGKEAAREAAELARSLRDPELLARAALTYGLSYSVGTTDHVLVQLLEEASAALPPGDLALRARLLARLAAALTPSRDMGPPIARAREAIAMASRIESDDRARLEVTHAALSALNLFIPPQERIAYSRLVLSLAERYDEPLLALRAQQRLTFDHFELGDPTGVDLHHQAYDRLVERVRLPRARWMSSAFRAMRALLHGQFAAHDEAFEDARRLADDAGDRFFAAVLACTHRLPLGLIRNDVDLLRRERATIQRPFHANGIPYLEISAIIHLRLGEIDELRALLARNPRLVDEVRNHHLPTLGAFMAEIAWELGDRDIAETLRGWLEPYPAPCVALHLHGLAVYRPLAHAMMHVLATLGDVDGARGAHDSALTLARFMDARPLEAWLELDFARVLIRAGNRGDEPRQLLARARDLSRSVGIDLERRIVDAEAQLGDARAGAVVLARPSQPAIDTDPQLSLRCEGEYWLVTGLSTECRIKGTKGVEMLARLVTEPNREIHALDLMGAEAVDGGDAGEVLDKAARDAYRARAGDLREALEEAESWNDAARVDRIRGELEALGAELSRASGIGGRERRVGRAAERARINVQRRLVDAIRRISEIDALLGKHLTASVRTGIYCSYAPERAARPR